MSTGTVWTVPHETEMFDYLHLRWDVAKAWALVGGQEVTDQIGVDQAARSGFGAPSAAAMLPPTDGSTARRIYLGVGVDTDWCLSTDVDLSRPLLVATRDLGDAGPITLIIDGYHRLFRAWHDGIETLPAILLTPEQERKARVR